MSDLDLALWQARYQEHLAVRQYAPQTIAYYTAELRPCFAYLEGHGVETVLGITTALLEGYRTDLFYAEYRGRRLSFETQSHRLSAVKGFTRFLWRARYLLTDPGATVELPKVERRLPRVFLSETDVTALLLAPPVDTVLGLRDRAILEVLYSTAIRNTELRLLKLDAVDFAQERLCIRRGKGGKGRLVPMGQAAADWLRTYLEQSRPRLLETPEEQSVFLTWRGRQFERQSLARLVRRAAVQAGLGNAVTTHALRHACASHMLVRGAGLRHLQDLLGHASPETTQRYTRLDITDLRQVHRRFHPREQDGPAGGTP